MEVKGLSNLIVSRHHKDIKARHRTPGQTPRISEDRSKYISSIERLRASKINLLPKSGLHRSRSISSRVKTKKQEDLESLQIPQRKQSLSLSNNEPSGSLHSQAESVLSSLKHPKKPLKFQAEDDFLQAVAPLSVKSITELKKKLTYNAKGLDCLFAFILVLADCDPAVTFLENSKTLTFKMIDQFKVYISNPGKIVQTIRNIPSCIRNGKVTARTIAKAKEYLGKPSQELAEVHCVVSETVKLYEIIKPTVKSEESKDAPFVCRVKKEVIQRKRVCTETDLDLDTSEIHSPYIHRKPNSSIHIIEADNRNPRQESSSKTKLLNRFLSDKNDRPSQTASDVSHLSDCTENDSPRKEVPIKQVKEHPLKEFLQEEGQAENLMGLVQSLMGSPVFRELINGLKSSDSSSQSLLRDLLTNMKN